MPRSKKPSGKRSAGAREVVYRRPYWFDRTRSLAELHGWPRSDASDGLGLVGRHGVAIARPVGQHDAEALELLFGQHTDPHYLVPVALELLAAGARPTLLACLLRLDAEFWRVHPYLCAALVERLVGGLGREDPDLTHAVNAFVERHRAR